MRVTNAHASSDLRFCFPVDHAEERTTVVSGQLPKALAGAGYPSALIDFQCAG